MKNMMKLIALMAAMAMFAAGCGSSETVSAETTEAATEAATEAGETEAAESGETEAAALTAEFFSNGMDENGNLVDVDPADFLELPDYSAVSVAKSEIELTEEDMNSSLQSMLESYATEVQVTDREVKDGDTINLDYVGSIDGVEFDGGSTQGAGTNLTIGSGSYIDNFEEQLIGHKPGEDVTVTVTFPENYSSEDLAGKEAVFACTINHIVESEVPELTDAFVAENLSSTYNANTVDELKEVMVTNYRKNQEMEIVWNWLQENTNFTAEPEALIASQLDNYVEVYRLYATSSGMTLEDYLSAYGSDESTIRSDSQETAVTTAKQMLIAQAIANAENLVVDDAALEEYFKGTDYTSYDEFYGTGYVRMQVLLSMVVDKIMETAVVE